MRSENQTVIDELLEEQKLLTAVSRFAQKHADEISPLQGRYYRDLIPLAAPQPGEQYAFEVDLDKCSGCKACVAACHSLNGLEPEESWRSVGVLVSAESNHGYQQTVTSACHHCAEPACLHGCPVLAYEKDPVTGIVHHLDDQCIGCQYCVLKCPYEVPRYSSRLGIVRKCDMCSGRLQAGEAPACVQSCPSEAIRITVVQTRELQSRYADETTNAFLPASPSPAFTIPATRYLSSRGFRADLQAGDEQFLKPGEPHWPLVWMLVLTQASVGSFASASLLSLFGSAIPLPFLATAGALGIGGLVSSLFHLGRPLHAWRAFMGVRRSWLSREILTFGAFASGVLLLLAREALPKFFPVTLHLTTAVGLIGVFTSIMVYHDTPREFWNIKRTLPRFLFTTALLGVASTLALSNDAGFLTLLIFTAAAITVFELFELRHLAAERFTPLKRSAILTVSNLWRPSLLRGASLLLGGIFLPLACLFRGTPANAWDAVLFFGLLLVSEMSGRSVFFRAVSQPKMPGGLP